MNDRLAAGRAYIRFVLKQKGLTPSGLAKLAGVSSSTLTRLLNKTDHKFLVSMKTLDKIAAATDLSYIPYFEAKEISKPSSLNVKSTLQGSFWKDALSNLIPVISAVCVDVWHNKSEPNFEASTFYVPIRLSKKELDDQFVVQVKGSSCNKFAVDGEFLLCEQLESGGLRSRQYFAIIERFSDDGNMVELSAQLVTAEGEKITYELPSSDPAYAGRKIEVPREGSDLIRTIGIVRFVFRRAPDFEKPLLMVH